MQRGATVVGGMPHWEATEDEQREHVRLCFELAARHDADVDMHVDETDDGSVRTLAMVVAETERRGWQGRVTVGHVCALAAADHDYAERVIADCARPASPSSSNPVTNLVLQGRGDRGLVRRGTTRVRELMAAGVPVAFGQDCVQDGFYPFGRGDLLEVALISAHAAHLAPRPSSSTCAGRRDDRAGGRLAARARLRRGRRCPGRPAALRSVDLAGGAAAAGPAARRCGSAAAGRPHDGHPRAGSGDLTRLSGQRPAPRLPWHGDDRHRQRRRGRGAAGG